MAFRRAVNRKLKQRGATFTQWRFLLAARLLANELGDKVSRQEIARRAGTDENTATVLMLRLARKGWLSVGIGGVRSAYRLFVTNKGKAVLAATLQLVLDAGMETCGHRLRAGA
jgi:DNA-binding MarR family transcriptional regulator